MVLRSTDMYKSVSDESDRDENGYVTSTAIASLDQAVQTLELLGQELITERPRAQAEHQLRIAMAERNAVAIPRRPKELSVVPVLPLRSMATSATTQGQYQRAF
jgi:ABC-type molybdate transport system ATPase subunit